MCQNYEYRLYRFKVLQVVSMIKDSDSLSRHGDERSLISVRQEQLAVSVAMQRN